MAIEWSGTRYKKFLECQRQYWFNYYGAQDGWRPTAPYDTKHIYRLKKMTTVPMLIGEIVHGAAEHYLKSFHATDGAVRLPQAEIEKFCTDWLERVARESEASVADGHWTPKTTILMEHYYHEPLERSYKSLARQKIARLVDALVGMDFFANPAPTRQWLTMEDFNKFSLSSGERIIVKMDWSYRTSDGKVRIIDWKTGKTESALTDQLVVYAMYALKQGWAHKPEDIVVSPVFLQDREAIDFAVTMNAMLAQASAIRTNVAELQEKDAHADDRNQWPTHVGWACKRCPFREICQNTTAS